MDSTDGLRRGMDVMDTGASIKIPVGEQVRGRLINVIGEPIDGISKLDKTGGYHVHNKAPEYVDLTTEKRSYIQE